MRLALIISILMVFALAACGEKPDAPDSPDPTTYGKTIEPDHNVPEEDRKDHQREIRGGTVEMDHNIPKEHRDDYEREQYAE
jgi:predicted small lipoprotein YifL